ncbi:MAG TPA: tetratricopeptide repeat protein [Chitinophagales bacterium]|nr:tetratricopeptide repeat protein [Chitinophagales bacterium]
MQKTKQILFISILFISNIIFAQTKIIDSLVQKVNTAQTKKEKLKQLLLLCEQHQSIHKDSLWQYAFRSTQIAANTNKQSVGLAKIAIINALLRFDKIDSAQKIIASELKNYSVNNKTERKIFFSLLVLKSNCYSAISNYKDAVAIMYYTIGFAEKYNDTATLAISYNSLGEIAYNRDMINESLQWFYKSLALTQNKKEYKAEKAVSYINLAIVYGWIGKSDSAKYYIQQSIPLCYEIQNLYYLCNALLNESSNYKNAKNYKEAERVMLEAMEIRKKTEGRIVFSNEQLALGNLYNRSGQYDKAIKIFKDGLAYDDSVNIGIAATHKKKSNLTIRLYYLLGLSRSYKAKGDLVLYSEMLQNLIAIKDTLYEVNAADAMADMQVKYETQKKENTIIQQQLDLSKKNNLLYGSIGLLAALAIIFGILFWSYKSRQELKLQQQIEEDKWLTQQEVAKAEEKERSRIAADLHDNLGVYAASIASNLNHIKVDEQHTENVVALNELRNNSQAIVSQLNDTIWVLKKDIILLTSVCDRIKLLISRTQKSFPDIEFNASEDIENDVEFSASHAYHLYRIIQEAINNALKHSQCSKIDIDVNSHENWTISIADNGVGISETSNKIKEGGNGLLNMQARGTEVGWTITWQQMQNNGTKVVIAPTTN